MFSIVAVAVGGTVLGLGGAIFRKKRKQRPLIEMLLPQTAANKTQAQKTTLAEVATDFSHRMAKIDDAYQNFIQTRFDPLFGKQAHLDFISDKQIVKSQMEKAVNRAIALAGISLGLVTVGAVVFPPFSWLAIPVMLYGNMPMFRLAYQDLFVDRRLTEATLGSLLLVGWIVGGYLFLGLLVLFSGVLWQKLLMLTRDYSEHTLVDLFGQQRREVAILVDGQEVLVSFDQVEEGDTVVVYAGEMIPIDGVVLVGEATVDQHMLTGESQPVEKSAGSSILAATTVISGQLQVRVEKAGRDSVAAQITDVLNQTSGYHTTIESRAMERVERAVPYRLGLSVVAYPIAGVGGSLAVLMASFGRAMQIYGSLSILNYLNIASHESILIKDGRSLELLPQINAVVFDKTGTLTTEQPHIAAIYPVNGYTANQLLTYAASAEYKQTHPIARAIVDYAQAAQVTIATPDDTEFEAGFGIRTEIENVSVLVGSQRFMTRSKIAIPIEIQAIEAEASVQGYSLVYVAIEQQLAGILELHSTVRPEVREIIQILRQRGLATFIISGDHEAPTRLLAQELGIDHYYAETLPEDKARIIDELQAAGHSVCFIGDGINDGIALRKAHVSISIRGATTVATDAAQIVMMDQSLSQLIPLFDLSREFNTNMKVNYIFAVGPSVIVVSGILLRLISLPGAIALAIPWLYLGLANAMLPLVRYRFKRSESTVY